MGNPIEVFMTVLFCAYFGFYNGMNLLLFVWAFLDVRKRLHLKGLEDYEVLENSPYTPPVSILVPAYNEAVTIEASLKSLMALRFPAFEILVVNDGSKDKTMEVLKKALKLRRRDFPFRAGIATAESTLAAGVASLEAHPLSPWAERIPP